MNVYTVYIWEYRKLLHVAENIVAHDCNSAVKRAVHAIRSRAGMDGDPTLRQLSLHLYGSGQPAPDGVQVQVQKRVGGPSTSGIICMA